MEMKDTQIPFSKQAHAHSNNVEGEKEELVRKAMEIARGLAFPMTLKSAMELNILEIISEASDRGAYLSASEVVGEIPDGCANPDAPPLLDRMLSLLTSFSILKCKVRSKGEQGGVERVYGVAPLCKFFLTNRVGLEEYSFRAWFLWVHDKVIFDMWNNMSDAILDGGIPFNKAYGMPFFEYTKKDMRVNKFFNESMSNNTAFFMKKILDIYQGFEGINILVDVGGGVGVTLNLVISKYPNIKGINFDLPCALADNYKKIPGVENVEGDMFERVPKGDAIFLKWILHDWSDEHCLKILKNCWKALAENGKVIVVEALLPLTPENNYESQHTLELDIAMFATFGAKERTKEEYEALAIQSGFSSCTAICSVSNMWVIEFLKA